MVEGHHLHLECQPSLFHNFTCFNVKAAVAHHPIIWKEVDELLTKGSIEPWMGGADFYSTLCTLTALCT